MCRRKEQPVLAQVSRKKPVKLQDVLSLNSVRSRFYPELERISESFRAKTIIQDLIDFKKIT